MPARGASPRAPNSSAVERAPSSATEEQPAPQRDRAGLVVDATEIRRRFPYACSRWYPTISSLSGQPFEPSCASSQDASRAWSSARSSFGTDA